MSYFTNYWLMIAFQTIATCTKWPLPEVSTYCCQNTAGLGARQTNYHARGGAVGLSPVAVPVFATADLQSTQRRHLGRTLLNPAQARSFQAFADDLASRLGVPMSQPLPWPPGAPSIIASLDIHKNATSPYFAGAENQSLQQCDHWNQGT